MEQQLHNIQIAFFAGLAVLIPSAFLFLKSHLELRTKFREAQLRDVNVDIDDTAMRNQISAEAQKIIQTLFVEKEQRIKRLEEQLDHQRDLIDTGASEQARLKAQKDEMEKSLNKSQSQQIENVKKLAMMETHVVQLKALEEENSVLKGEIAELRQKMQEAEVKADQRHKEMSEISGRNFELNIQLRTVNETLDNVRRLLRECNEEVSRLKSQDNKEIGNESELSTE